MVVYQSTNNDVFENSDFDEKYRKENKYTRLIPAYIREYPKFIDLMKIFSNYIQSSVDTVEYILNKLNITDATGDILEKIAERLDICIEKPLKENGTVDQELYEQQLKIAILGNGLKRTSTANRESLSKLVNIFSSIIKCEITDYSNSSVSQTPMTVQIDITGTNDIWSREMLEQYVLPNITGVRIVVNYILNNNMYFGHDIHDVINIIGSINLATLNVTQEALYAKAVELGYSSSELVLGITITDAEDNGWSYINNTTGWMNKGTVVNGQDIYDESIGYGIQGWDRGKWADTTVIK